MSCRAILEAATDYFYVVEGYGSVAKDEGKKNEMLNSEILNILCTRTRSLDFITRQSGVTENAYILKSKYN